MNKRGNSTINIRFVVVACLCMALLIGVIIWSAVISSRKEKEIRATTEEENPGEEYTEDIQAEQDNFEISEPVIEISDEMRAEYLIFDIVNRSELIEPVLGNWSYLLNEALADYATAQEIDATAAECIECNIPDYDKADLEFYFECLDPEKTVLVVVYDKTDRSTEVQQTDLTREEVEKLVWSPYGEPLIRDTENEPEAERE